MIPSTLKHLAIIMDGNGHWAKKQGQKRFFGHTQGLKNTLKILEHCCDLQIPYLTLFVLSAENLDRPLRELEGLKKLLEKALNQYSGFLFKKNIIFHFIGDISVFSQEIQDRLCEIRKKTSKNKGLHLVLALNYGGQQEIQKAFHKALNYCLTNNQAQLSQKKWTEFLPSAKYPPPDLIVRTGGQMRLSNFYLWSSAYSELSFTQKPWPEFLSQDLDQILQNFYKRSRNFGRVKA